MATVTVILPPAEVTVQAAGSAAVCVLPDAACAVTLGCAPVAVTMGELEVSVLCDVVVESTAFVTPTIVSVECDAIDYLPGETGATVRFSFHDCETDGTPCRARWRLVSTHDELVFCDTKNKSDESLLQPDTTIDLSPYVSEENRDVYYDLWWRWTSGSHSIDWTLVQEDFVVAPWEGDGDNIGRYP